MTAQTELASADQRMSQAGKTFYRAARLLPRRLRLDVVALYGFCRTVDDLADDPSQPVADRRRSLIVLATALECGNSTELLGVGWPFAEQDLLAAAAAMLVRAAIEDLHQQQPTSTEDLLAYAFGVAGTVGIMMARVLEARPEGYGAAVALGMAMQLTNICRDVAEDQQMGRVYLPEPWISAEAVRRAVEDGDAAATRQTLEAVRNVLSVADGLYEFANDGFWTLPWRVRWSILAAGMCYREIGAQVMRSWPRALSQRAVVSSGRKLWLIALAGLRVLSPRFWWPRNWPRNWQPRNLSWPATLGPAALEAGRSLGVNRGA
jgi:phytoene synthase